MKKLAWIAMLAWPTQHHAQFFLNPSLETWGSAAVCDTGLAPDNWQDYSNMGTGMDEALFPLCATTIPPAASHGVAYGRAQAFGPVSGEGMYQFVFGLTIGQTYHVRFDFTGSNLDSGTSDVQWHLYFNDIDIAQTTIFSSTDSVWHSFIYPFSATSSFFKIGVRAFTASAGLGSAAIDNFSINIGTGYEEIETTRFMLLAPNPMSDHCLLISSSPLNPGEVVLYDPAGRMVRRLTNVTGDRTRLDRDGLSPGIYSVQVCLAGRTIHPLKLIVMDE